ncbi:hypothetical protein BGZ49_002584 [Haplosporangium sp. Z 27]|nr:hypothetical protein BGZ49_002584 [Haplosporangium sp. Z 27]
MTSNLHTLFCIVEGDSSPFSVKIASNESVDELKKAIKAEKAVLFSDVDADNLTLWRVEIPLVPLKDRKPIVLNDDDSATELDQQTTSLMSLRFNRPRKQLALLFSDQPQHQQLVLFPEMPRDHVGSDGDFVHGASIMDVETSQRGVLGRFYKRPLPYHEKAENISLVMLGLELDKQAKTSEGETLREIVDKDVGRSTDLRVVTMVAPSGSGKTATVVDLASRHFVIYAVCCVPSPSISPGFSDSNFITLTEDIESMYRAVIHRNQGGSQDAVDIDSEVKALAGERVKIEFLARQLFLLHLLENNPNLQPRQFFQEQTTTNGALTIGKLVDSVRDYDTRTIRAILGQVQFNIRRHLLPRKLGVVFALDEAQAAANDILSGKLISPSALAKNRKTLFDEKNQIRSEYRRGFLTQLSATLSNMQATLVILGTALSLQNADHVYSAVAK